MKPLRVLVVLLSVIAAGVVLRTHAQGTNVTLWGTDSSGNPHQVLTDTSGRPIVTVTGGTISPSIVRTGDGSRLLPTQSWANEPTSGRYRVSSNTFGESVNTSVVWAWNSTVLNFKSALKLGFSTGDPAAVGADVVWWRQAAKTLQVDTDGAGGNLTAINLKGNVFLSQAIAQYNGVSTAGNGVAVIVGAGRATAQTGANASVATYTPSADGDFVVSANLLATTATTFSFNVQASYKDEGGTARTANLTFNTGGSATPVYPANGNGALYEGYPIHIRAQAGTAITVLTTGTFTTVTYNISAVIRQLQ